MNEREATCDGCGTLAPCKRGVCAMCRADGVPGKPRCKPLPASWNAVAGGPPDNMGTTEMARQRALAIRAEDPEGWADAIGPLRTSIARDDDDDEG